MTRFLLLTVLALAISGCDSSLDIDLPEQEPRLVIESLFAADSLITLMVRQSATVLDPGGIPLEAVASATVQIFEDGELAGMAPYVSNRFRFVSDVRARAGRTYAVRVTAPGFDPVEAEDTVPVPIPFELDLVRGPEPDDPDRDRLDALTIRFTDPPGDTHYALYGLVETRFSGTFPPQIGSIGFRSSDPLFADGDLTELISDFDEPFYSRAVFTSRPFDGESVSAQVSISRRSEARPEYEVIERLRLATLSETYYRYLSAIDGNTEGTPFLTPRETPSNVTGGYGIFAAFAASEVVIPR